MSIEELKLPKRIDEEKLQAFKELFPDVFADGKVNLAALKDELGEETEDDDVIEEHYGLNWPGKRAAKKLAVLPPSGTLNFAEGEGIDEETTQNIFVEGDNLEVLRILQKSYAGRIKMIYIDPPYNTGQDFIYKDDFKEPVETYLEKTGQADEEGLLTSNPKASGRYHSNWMSMMYPRLRLARNLLSSEGLIFVSIDDNEISNLRSMLNEIYGEENFVSQIIIESNKRGQTYKDISKTHEYLLCYSKTEDTSINELEKEGEGLKFSDDIGNFDIRELRNRNPKFGRFNRPNLYYPIYVCKSKIDKDGFCPISLVKNDIYELEVYPLNSEGKESCWRWGTKLFEKQNNIDTLKSNIIAKQRRDGGWNIYEKYRKTTYKVKSIWDETEVINEQGTIDLKNLGLGGFFDFPKPVALIKKCLLLGTDKNDFVLDFFAGSATIAQSLYELNSQDDGERKFICIQLPVKPSAGHLAEQNGFKTIAEVSKERIRRSSSKLKTNGITGDLGFKTYKLDKSNIVKWQNYTGSDINHIQDLFANRSNSLIDNWKDSNVITEIMLIEGFPLESNKSEQAGLQGNKVWVIEHPDIGYKLLICLDAQIDESTLSLLSKNQEAVLVCLDIALSDQAKLILSDCLKVKTI